MGEITNIFNNNKLWSEQKLKQDSDFFKKNANEQKPKYLWIGCSDSRVPPEIICGLNPGEIFVHRNIANIVNPSDLNTMSVIEFAVKTLKVTDIIVCGHYGCGGVRAAMTGEISEKVNQWLEPIKSNLQNFLIDQYSEAVESNVKSQMEKIYKIDFVNSAIKSGHNLKIHGWVYDLKNGLLKNLCFKSIHAFEEM